MVTLEVKTQDHLRNVFYDTPFLKVENDPKNNARNTLLLWLVSSKNGLWLSDHPDDAQQALQERFEIYHQLDFSHITFTSPHKLSRNTFQKCVIEQCDFDYRAMNVASVRVLETPIVETYFEALNMTLEEKRATLQDIRLGVSTNYDEDEIVASVCRESYFDFIKEFWGEIVQESPVWNWHIEVIAAELQYLAERVFKGLPKEHDLIINVPPGESKSTICSIMFNPWTWTRMPSARTLGGSYGGILAGNLASKNRDVVLSDKYKRLFPEIKLRVDQASKTHFENTLGGSRFSFGMQGTVTGMHAHFIGIDDPLNPEKAVSEVELNKANRVMSETLFTRKVDKALTPTYLIMQRLHQNDCTQHMLDTYEKVKHICLPAELDDNVQPEELRSKYVDGLLDVERLPKKVLESNKKALGTYAYAGQFSQRPSPRGGAMFKPARIIVDVRPTRAFFQRIIRYWDKAGTDGDGCYTAGVEMGLHKDGSIWVLDVVRGQWSMDERERTIKETAKLDGHDTEVWVEQEPGSGGKDVATYTVKNLIGFHVQIDKVGSNSGNKVARALPFADQVNSGNVHMVRADWNKPYIDELTFAPNSTYKDQWDASAGACNKLGEEDYSVGAL